MKNEKIRKHPAMPASKLLAIKHSQGKPAFNGFTVGGGSNKGMMPNKAAKHKRANPNDFHDRYGIKVYHCGCGWGNRELKKFDASLENGKAVYRCRKCRAIQKSGKPKKVEQFDGVKLVAPASVMAILSNLPAKHSAERIRMSQVHGRAAKFKREFGNRWNRQVAREAQQKSEHSNAHCTA